MYSSLYPINQYANYKCSHNWFGMAKNGPRRDQYPSPEIQTKTTNAAPDKQAQAARKKQLYIQTKNKAKLKTG